MKPRLFCGAGRRRPPGARAMDIDWMIGDELAEAIPPAYTEHVGEQLMAHLRAAENASGHRRGA